MKQAIRWRKLKRGVSIKINRNAGKQHWYSALNRRRRYATVRTDPLKYQSTPRVARSLRDVGKHTWDMYKIFHRGRGG